MEGPAAPAGRRQKLSLAHFLPTKQWKEKGELFGEQLAAIHELKVFGPGYDDDEMTFVDDDVEGSLPSVLAKHLKDSNIDKLLPVQRWSLPILETCEHDLFVEAPTGSGKTYAFLLPVVKRLLEIRKTSSVRPNRPFALVISNTQLLSTQTFRVAKDLCAAASEGGTKLSVAGVIGQTEQCTQELAKGVDIVIASSGRLKDYIDNKHVLFDDLQYMIYDEADKMTTQGAFRDDVTVFREAMGDRTSEICSGFFTATMALGDFTDLYRPSYVIIESPPNRGIQHFVLNVPFYAPTYRRELLLSLLQSDLALQEKKRGVAYDKYEQKTVVFCREKRVCNMIAAYLLRYGFCVALINSDRSLTDRNKQVEEMQQGKRHVIVATDSFARGHDVDGITHVINFDPPYTVEDYVHRSGRTGRRGHRGRCTTFLDPREHKLTRELGAFILRSGQRIPHFIYKQSVAELKKRYGLEEDPGYSVEELMDGGEYFCEADDEQRVFEEDAEGGNECDAGRLVDQQVDSDDE